MSDRFTRREMLKIGGIAAATAAITSLPASARAVLQSAVAPSSAARKRVLRLAHLTDIHVQPELHAGEGLSACLRHVQQMKDKPELIITGGDQVMDSMAKDHARTRTQWDLWKKVLTDECSLPLEHCLGNHDVWGWDKKKSGTTGAEPEYGKKWAMDMTGMTRPYRSFDRAGWKVVVLDSIHAKDDSYIGKLDDEQFEWLSGELAGTDAKMNVLVVSHIPILAVCVLTQGPDGKTGDFGVSGAMMHLDSKKIRGLFAKHTNVRACLSGHVHLLDRVEYNGVRFYCNGAVCGSWWKGANHECREGYAAVDLYDDGTVEREYVEYGWVAAK